MATAGSNGRGKRKGSGGRRAGGGGTNGHSNGAGGGRSEKFKFTIQSEYPAVREVQQNILEAVVRAGFDEHNLFAIKLALEEGLMNAIKHGNKLDKKKKVHVAAAVTGKQVEIVIEDEGPGFDRGCVPDPTEEGNLHKCSGRGLLLIESYMNEVQYSLGGRRVRMVKRNEPNVLPRKK